MKSIGIPKSKIGSANAASFVLRRAIHSGLLIQQIAFWVGDKWPQAMSALDQ
jgi:hypothetical protein